MSNNNQFTAKIRPAVNSSAYEWLEPQTQEDYWWINSLFNGRSFKEIGTKEKGAKQNDFIGRVTYRENVAWYRIPDITVKPDPIEPFTEFVEHLCECESQKTGQTIDFYQ